MGETENFQRKIIRLPRPHYVGRQWYFLTACTQDRAPHLRKAELVSHHLALLTEQAQRDSFDVIAYCFMPDHLHLLVSGMSEDSNCLAFMRTFKQRSGFAFRRFSRGRLWQHKFYDHILRPRDQWESVAWYIWTNPVRKGLCAGPEDWPFSGSQSIDWKQLLRPCVPLWTPPWKRGGLT
jgi:putative transposase